jgi:arylformamidase
MKIIDISVAVDASLPVWPGDPSIRIDRFLDISRGDAVNASSISCSLHTGSHVDAPFHHLVHGRGVDELPLTALIGPAVVADLTAADEIGPRELEALRLPERVERLLCRTRNSAFWGDADRGFRTNFIAVTAPGAEWLVKRGIRLVGVDYLSVERFGAEPSETHRRLLEAEVVILEGLDLRDARPGQYWLACLPWKVRGVDGAPARAVLIEGALS